MMPKYHARIVGARSRAMLLQFMDGPRLRGPIPDTSIAMGYSGPGSVMLGTKDEQRAGR